MIVFGYISNLSTACEFPKLPSTEFLVTHQPQCWEPHTVASLKQELKQIFVVPRLQNKHIHESQNRVNEFHVLEAFLSLLLQLLYHKTNLHDGVDMLEKELRFLHTILGDISWKLLDSNAEFQKLLPEFEAVANQAGSFVHCLFFSADPEVEKVYEVLVDVRYHTGLLEAKLRSSISASAYTTPGTSIVDSVPILDSLVDYLEDLQKQEDNQIADVKDQVKLLHQGLMPLHSSINEMRSPQPSEIEQLKEPLMRIGGIAHQLITTFLVKDAPLWYVVHRITYLNRMIEPIRTELQLITVKYKFGGVKVAKEPLQDKRNTEVNDVTVGFEDKTTEILGQLAGGGTESLQIISILGMPGLGKTTLAKKLYNHPLINYTFIKLSWCVVSQTYKRQSILANILIQINSELGKDVILNMEEMSLVEHIHKTLMGRRYLIVLDDIWDSNVSDELLRCFPDNGNGSKILLIGRNKEVAPSNSTIHELSFLSDEQCWELLEKKTFGNRTSPPELQEIGKKIAARCCGLPLTVVVIAGVLSIVDEEESKWEEVRGSLGSYIEGEDNSVMQNLESSYKHLLDHLKPCFLYFGEFEEDEEIYVEKLKRLWVAEGFVRRKKDKSAENIAGEYLMELIDKNLVMIAKRKKDRRGAKSCVIHDLLRELCLKISREESFLKYLDNDYHIVHEKGHRLRTFGDSATLSYCQHVRSFVGYAPSESFYVRDMRLLRVLYFDSFYTRSLTYGIEYLVNLRFLVIDNLPTWIDRLVNLECLHVGEATVDLPPTIMKMKKLRYLHASLLEYGENWNISNQTCNLEYLSMVMIRKREDEEMLKCSPHLRKLKCFYSLDEETACPHFDLRFLTQLDSLYVIGHCSIGDFGFSPSIRELTLHSSFMPWEKMSIVGRLENLEVLKLIRDAFMGETWETRDDEFQKLKFLHLDCFRFLSEWNVASSEHFPKLQTLILECVQLQEIPSEIGEITTLELIEVRSGCPKSLQESAERIKEEQRDMGNEELKVIINVGAGYR